MKLVAYCRVSTDDLGQDPKRQEELIRGWAKGNGIELVAVVLDEGTSGSITPLSRPKVREAIRLAKEHNAEGLVVETADRWTRAGFEDGVMSRAALANEHQLKLFMMDLPFATEKLAQDILLACRDAINADWLRKHRARVAQGLRRAKERGWPAGRPGRPPKEPLNLEERQMVLAMIEAGKGSRLIAHAVNLQRRAFAVADPSIQAERKVSEAWVRGQVRAWCAETPAITARVGVWWPAAVGLPPMPRASRPKKPVEFGPRPKRKTRVAKRQRGTFTQDLVVQGELPPLEEPETVQSIEDDVTRGGKA